MPLYLSAPLRKSFNIVINVHGRTQNCDFLVLGRIYPFLANLVQKIKVVSLG